MSKQISLFVPGRLCLFGEHSDWAGMQRMINADIPQGRAIVTGIEEGIYATAERAERFVVESDLEIFRGDNFSCEMNTAKLLETARDGGFFSYVAGVAAYINDNYSVGGLRIRVTKMDLPIRSGLSSSAAICVLVARAFNQIYHLKMNTKGEMQAAFRGEQKTPSRCGRLDQACAYGVKPVLMEFDGAETDAYPLELGATFYWLIADLRAHKDTVKILGDLNRCYPFPKGDMEQAVHEALGVDNQRIIAEALKYLTQGDAQALGKLMCEAQENFDRKVAPACPEELTSPVLHGILEDETVRRLTYGAKGVGSQGDGTVQFLCKDPEGRAELARYLKNVKGMPSFPLTLKPGQSVKRAIIPVAGFGTRLYPATKGIKKDFVPVVDKDGLLKPALLVLLEQLDEAGIEEICLVIGEDEQGFYESFFAPLPDEHLLKLSDDKRAYEERIVALGRKITYVLQRERLGFGHAVYQCRAFTAGEPVLLLLGDTIYESYTEENCSKQLVKVFESLGKTTVSIHTVPADEVMHYGILHGQWDDEWERILKIDQMCEKPTRDYAAEYLRITNQKKEDHYYAVFGQYVLTPEVFAELEDNIKNGKTSGGEYQLTDALDQVREKVGMYGYRVNGRMYDLGLPEAYREAVGEFGKTAIEER